MTTPSAFILCTTGAKQALEAILRIYYGLVAHFNALEDNWNTTASDLNTASLRFTLTSIEQQLGMRIINMDSKSQALESILRLYHELVTHFGSLNDSSTDDSHTADLRVSLASIEQQLGLEGAFNTRTTTEHAPASFSFTVPDLQQTAQFALDAQYSVDYRVSYAGAVFESLSYTEAYQSDLSSVPQSTSYDQASVIYDKPDEALQAEIDAAYMYGQSNSAYGFATEPDASTSSS
ncbi:hypothetical protein BJ508DRAFT_307597 [Ascobolus immersus RN42]|uniref:Uncharacterized protein n=1 Tax=Ascobolus immersus RN42 TaxID=1160509 RepID=A0A3N4I265_ASCIM|nr:hypothetical protein BJ508DRAFT_307597 [Ascobolus immersus RN42]